MGEKDDSDRSAATEIKNNTKTDDNPIISIHRDLLKRLLRRPQAVAVGKTDTCPSYSEGSMDKSVSFVRPYTSGNDRYFQNKTRLSSSARAIDDSHSDQEEEELKETLHQLRIKKAMLISDISMELSKSTTFATTVAENLGVASHENLKHDHKKLLFRRSTHQKEKNHDHVASNCTQEDNKNFALLVQKISELRRQRRLIGAHRLTGISICLISNTNSSQSACIAARFDLCSHEGHFFFPIGSINSNTSQQPVVFLDLLCATITPNNASLCAKRLLLRLAQHTLPKTISISDVMQTCFCSPDRNHYSTKRQRRRKTWLCHQLLSNVVLSSDDQGSITLDLGPFHDDGDYAAVALQGKILITCLRVCLGAIYDAIHAYEQRVHLCQWMLQQQKHSAITTNGNILSTTNGMRLQDVVFSNSYDRIAFSVVLHYTMDNPCIFFPVSKIHRTLKVQLTFDHDGATPDKISLGWADTLDHLDVHWILSDVTSWIQFFPIPQVLKRLEQTAQQELCQN